MSVVGSKSHTHRHAQAVTNSLRMADEAAERGDYHDALGWLEAVRATGERLSEEYQGKRAAWMGKTVGRGAQPAFSDGLGDAES